MRRIEWLGTTVENQRFAGKRVPFLLDIVNDRQCAEGRLARSGRLDMVSRSGKAGSTGAGTLTATMNFRIGRKEFKRKRYLD